MTNVRQYVDPPTFTALPFGLLASVTDLRSPADPHWQAGVTWQPLCGIGGSTYEKCLTVSGSGVAPVARPAPKSDTTETVAARGATAFSVFAEVDCSPVGFWDDAEASVGELLTHAEQWQVERAFATGAVAGAANVMFPHLAANAVVTDESNITLQTAATTVTGSTVDVVEGVGRLEQALADCYDGVGYLHVPRMLAPALAFANLLVRDGPRYRTPSGNVVVLGAGYSGTAPDGSAPVGARWIYATGAVFAYRSRPRVLRDRDSLDRAKNTLKAIAERTYVIGWDCCHLGIPVSDGGIVMGSRGLAT